MVLNSFDPNYDLRIFHDCGSWTIKWIIDNMFSLGNLIFHGEEFGISISRDNVEFGQINNLTLFLFTYLHSEISDQFIDEFTKYVRNHIPNKYHIDLSSVYEKNSSVELYIRRKLIGVM